MLTAVQDYEKKKFEELEKYARSKKFYRGPALDYEDPLKAKILAFKEKKMKSLVQWKGKEDIELITGLFMGLLTSPAYAGNKEDEDDDDNKKKKK